jgi:glutamate synthase domain-containing protein 2
MPPVREIYPLVIGGMSFGALSPNMWEGLQLGVAYLNEELGMPVRMCTGEGRLSAAPAAQSDSSSTPYCRSPAAISAGTKSFTPSRR